MVVTDCYPPLRIGLRRKREVRHLVKVIFNLTVVGHQAAKQQLIGFAHWRGLILRFPMAYLAGAHMHVSGEVRF